MQVAGSLVAQYGRVMGVMVAGSKIMRSSSSLVKSFFFFPHFFLDINFLPRTNFLVVATKMSSIWTFLEKILTRAIGFGDGIVFARFGLSRSSVVLGQASSSYSLKRAVGPW
ncbi:4889_t:CDS:2, partial [Dentiscutata erythropus]